MLLQRALLVLLLTVLSALALPTLLPTNSEYQASQMMCDMNQEDSTLTCYDIDLDSVQFDTLSECIRLTPTVTRCSRYLGTTPIEDNWDEEIISD